MFWSEKDGVSNNASRGKEVAWTTRIDRILRNERYPHQELVGFFRHQLRLKTRTDRKCLPSADFSEKWANVVSLVRVNGTSDDFPFLVSFRYKGTVS